LNDSSPFDGYDGTQPGEYEINLMDDESGEGSTRFSNSPSVE
jgi:hypothetical protein